MHSIQRSDVRLWHIHIVLFLHAQCSSYDGSSHLAVILCREQGKSGRAGEKDREETEPGGPDEAEVGGAFSLPSQTGRPIHETGVLDVCAILE